MKHYLACPQVIIYQTICAFITSLVYIPLFASIYKSAFTTVALYFAAGVTMSAFRLFFVKNSVKIITVSDEGVRAGRSVYTWKQLNDMINAGMLLDFDPLWLSPLKKVVHPEFDSILCIPRKNRTLRRPNTLFALFSAKFVCIQLSKRNKEILRQLSGNEVNLFVSGKEK